MIKYTLHMFVQSRSQGGYGKYAWRRWSATRYFENNELPRLPVVGGHVGVVTDVVCVAIHDSFGGFNADDDAPWDPALPVTSCYFKLYWFTETIDDLPCWPSIIGSADNLRKRLEAAGFSVIIGPPSSIQEPTETPPPVQT